VNCDWQSGNAREGPRFDPIIFARASHNSTWIFSRMFMLPNSPRDAVANERESSSEKYSIYECIFFFQKTYVMYYIV
jgi:hypothetical protein